MHKPSRKVYQAILLCFNHELNFFFILEGIAVVQDRTQQIPAPVHVGILRVFRISRAHLSQCTVLEYQQAPLPTAQRVGWLVVGIDKYIREKFAFWLGILVLPPLTCCDHIYTAPYISSQRSNLSDLLIGHFYQIDRTLR